MKDQDFFRSLSDQDLTHETHRLATRERHATVDLIACLEEFDRRDLCLGLGYSSIYTYCRYALRLGEGSTAARVAVARAYRRFPVVLQQLRDGALPLTHLALLAWVMTEANHVQLLAAAAGKTKNEVLVIVAAVSPRQDVRTSIRKSPTPRLAATPPTRGSSPAPASTSPLAGVAPASAPGRTGGPSLFSVPAAPDRPSSATAADTRDAHAADAPQGNITASREVVMRPVPPSVVLPLTPERYKVQVTISKEAHDNLRELQRLMRHTFPSGDAALIVERALAYLLDRVQQRKLAMLKKDRAAAKYRLTAG